MTVEHIMKLVEGSGMKTKLVLAIASLLSLAAHAECYSEGVRIGVVQKFSNKGLVNKSYEGELVMDGMKIRSSKSGASGGNVWRFSTDSTEVAKVIDDAVMTGNTVALKYCEISPLDVTRRMRFETPYIITQAVERKQ